MYVLLLSMLLNPLQKGPCFCSCPCGEDRLEAEVYAHTSKDFKKQNAKGGVGVYGGMTV